MPAAIQKFLPIKAELRLPTVDLAGARSITTLHENEIKKLIQEGQLVAWDISRSFAYRTKTDDDRSRAEYRILAASAKAWPNQVAFDDDKIELLLHGRPRPYILGRDWFRAWNCDSGHVINLIADGTLGIIPGTTWGRGAGNTPCITWQSAMTFLRERRLP